MLAVQINSMKRLVLAVALSVGVGSAALAADLPAPPVQVPATYPFTPYPFTPPYNWTGFYVGGNFGLGWSWGGFSDPLGNTLSLPNSAQLLGGGQVGLNYQFDNGFLIGAEADFDWLTNTNSTSSAVALVNPAGVPTGSSASVTVNNRRLTTATGRFGYTWDRVLLYTKGGGAWVASNNPTVTIDNTPVALNTTNINWGWTVGLGAEWAFWGNWSARIEFDYVGLNSPTFTIPASVGGLPAGD
jgi:outer membrane immunogenic protein